MAQRIYKYPIPARYNLVSMPKGAEVLSTQLQGNVLTMWALVDDKQPPVERWFVVRFTGEELNPSEHSFVGTVQMPNDLVLHVLESAKGEVAA